MIILYIYNNRDPGYKSVLENHFFFYFSRGKIKERYTKGEIVMLMSYVSVQQRCESRQQRIAGWHIRSFVMRGTDTDRHD